MRDFHLLSLGPEGSDCTSLYGVVFHKTLTVREFVEQLLSEEEDDEELRTCYGKIVVLHAGDNYWTTKNIIEYNKTKILSEDESRRNHPWYASLSKFSDDILDSGIQYASCSGGWGRMDYTIYI